MAERSLFAELRNRLGTDTTRDEEKIGFSASSAVVSESPLSGTFAVCATCSVYYSRDTYFIVNAAFTFVRLYICNIQADTLIVNQFSIQLTDILG